MTLRRRTLHPLPAMDYQHDIFISYRRHAETRAWIEEHFKPLLELRVEQELNRRPDLYVDTRLESGSTWPADLAVALGRSRILIALWSGNYLASPWCTLEFSLMLRRERESGLRTVEYPHGIVVPAFIHDGNKFPTELAHISYFEIQQSFNVRMARNSPRAEELDGILAAQAPAIAHCIEAAPTWNSAWSALAADALFAQLHQRAPAQSILPRFTTA